MISTLKSSHRKKNIVHVDCRSILHSPYVISFLFLCSTKFQSMDEQQSIYTVSTEIWPSVWQSQPSQQTNSRSDDVLAAGTASGCWATWELVKLSQKYTGYTALHNSQSHRISQSQALSARFIIFCFRYHGNTVLNVTVPGVLPQSLSP